MDTSYEVSFLSALCLTVLAETPVLFLVARKLLQVDRKAASDGTLLFCGIALSFSCNAASFLAGLAVF